MRRFTLALGALALTAAPAARADVRVYTAPEGADALSLQSFDLYGWIQPRFAIQQHDDRKGVDFDPNPAFTIRRARLGGIAWLTTWAKAQFEMELAGTTPYVLDAFLDAHPIPEIGLVVGQFRVPFSRQNLIPSKNLQFADTAYFVAPKYIVDRDIGAMLSGELLEKRLRYSFGVWNGNEPGRGQTQNLDPYLLWAGRIEATPLGPAPRFEGDLRPVEERARPLALLGVGFMRNRLDDKHFRRTYLGVDAGAWWQGASLYAELYAHRDAVIDDPRACSASGVGWALRNDTPDDPASRGACVTAVGWNVQAGYFPPVGWMRQHLELAVRVERFDPAREVDHPANDPGARDLDQSNPTWGYQGWVFGVNAFPKATHDLKLQASYELRNETKRCLEGQGGYGGDAACTGFIANNLLLVQATGAF